VTSPGAVTAVELGCPLRISTEAGDVTVVGSLGTLRLRSKSGAIRVSEARSADVLAAAAKAPISLSFAAPPSRVVAESDVGDISVELPGSSASYHFFAAGRDSGSEHVGLEDVPSAERTIRAETREGAVRIQKRPSETWD